MLDKKINEYYFNKKVVKYCKWFRLVFDNEGKYNPQSFNELVDCMKKYFRNSKKLNKIYYEKKELESKTNCFSTTTSLLQYFTSLMTILAIFIASIFSIVTSIKFYNDIIKNNALNHMLDWIWLPTVVLFIMCSLLYVLDMKLNDSFAMKRSFNLLCLGIIYDIEKEVYENNDEDKANSEDAIDIEENVNKISLQGKYKISIKEWLINILTFSPKYPGLLCYYDDFKDNKLKDNLEENILSSIDKMDAHERYQLEKKLRGEIKSIEMSELSNLISLAGTGFGFLGGYYVARFIDTKFELVGYILIICAIMLIYFLCMLYNKRKKYYIAYYDFYLSVLEDFHEYGLNSHKLKYKDKDIKEDEEP